MTHYAIETDTWLGEVGDTPEAAIAAQHAAAGPDYTEHPNVCTCVPVEVTDRLHAYLLRHGTPRRWRTLPNGVRDLDADA